MDWFEPTEMSDVTEILEPVISPCLCLHFTEQEFCVSMSEIKTHQFSVHPVQMNIIVQSIKSIKHTNIRKYLERTGRLLHQSSNVHFESETKHPQGFRVQSDAVHAHALMFQL